MSVSTRPDPVGGPVLEGEVLPPDWDHADAGDVAAYTDRLMRAAFVAENAEHQADRDHAELTMSSVGGCTRAAAYAIARWPMTNPPGGEEARQAMLGTWIHEVLLPRLAQLAGPGAVIEQRVELNAGGLTIRGTLDLAFGPVVWDLKTVGEFRLTGVRRLDGAYVAHWLQVMGYAYARWQAGYPVRWVVWIYLDRASGEHHVEVDEFIQPETSAGVPPQIDAVVRRLEEIRYWSATPAEAPRQLAAVEGRTTERYMLRGPGLSIQCDHCEWLTECWPGARPGVKGAQRILAATPEGIETALAMYAAGAKEAGDGRAKQEFAKEVLAEVPDDVYGRWLFKHGRPGMDLDEAAVRADYAARGVELPMKRTAGRTIVKPVARAEGEV